MSERLDSLLGMGLPAAVLQALVPRSPSLAPPEHPRTPVTAAAPDVDRYVRSDDASESRDAVVTDLRDLAQLHQARQAAQQAA